VIGLLLAIAGLATWGVLATVETVVRDGYRQVPVDPDRLGAR